MLWGCNKPEQLRRCKGIPQDSSSAGLNFTSDGQNREFHILRATDERAYVRRARQAYMRRPLGTVLRRALVAASFKNLRPGGC